MYGDEVNTVAYLYEMRENCLNQYVGEYLMVEFVWIINQKECKDK